LLAVWIPALCARAAVSEKRSVEALSISVYFNSDVFGRRTINMPEF